jgi:hypothetical protein
MKESASIDDFVSFHFDSNTLVSTVIWTMCSRIEVFRLTSESDGEVIYLLGKIFSTAKEIFHYILL